MSAALSAPIVKKPIITELNRAAFQKLLENNPGQVILKFGAEWCGPCGRIKPLVEAFFATSPDSVVCGDIDVDESFDLYAFLKSKRMVTGVPAILCYRRGNTSFIPDDSVTGADAAALDAFFRRCGDFAATGVLPKNTK